MFCLTFVGQGLCVGYHYEYPFELPAVLELDSAAERTYVVTDMKSAGRSVAGQDDFPHALIDLSNLKIL